MNESLKKVLEFHEVFEHPIGLSADHEEELSVRQLRIKLLFEELRELAVAGDVMYTFGTLCHETLSDPTACIADGYNVDKLEELDACADIQYVLNGKILTAGFKDIFDHGFDQVHGNNMTKAHRDISHAEKTAVINELKGFTIIERNGRIILLNASGKVTKPHDHVKVKLSLE